ncbi:MAG: HNH endonuclease signature motif containing protein [Burkholderiales bacterium]
MGLGTSAIQRQVRVEHLRPIEDAFWSRVADVDDSGCMLWTRGRTGRGYGNFHIPTACSPIAGTLAIGAHRVAWALANDRVPPADQVIDHLCGTRACCNPNHLELVPQRINAERGGNLLYGFVTAKPKPCTSLVGITTWRVRFRKYDAAGKQHSSCRTFASERAALAFIEANRGAIVNPGVAA